MAKILIADDDLISRELVAAAAELLGHVPLLSPDGDHAL